jgi:hypothetical protein
MGSLKRILFRTRKIVFRLHNPNGLKMGTVVSNEHYDMPFFNYGTFSGSDFTSYIKTDNKLIRYK